MNVFEKAAEIHANKYDYTNFAYKNRHAKGEICCPEHGVFLQDMHSHLKGHGCAKCKGVGKKTAEDFLAEAVKVHGGTFDYTNTVFSGWTKKVTIRCRVHGEFSQGARNHIRTTVCCPVCEGEKLGRERTVDPTAKLEAMGFIVARAGKSHDKATVVCEKHGEFSARPQDLYNGSKCPKCAVRKSSGEKELLGFIKGLFDGGVIAGDRTLIGPKEVDVYVPSKAIAVEYNGLWFHGDNFPDARMKHLRKTKAAEAKGVRLIHVFEDEWWYRNKAVKNALRCIFGKAEKRHARKGAIREESAADVAEFLEEHHLQGSVSAGVAISLFFGEERAATMVFSNSTNSRGSLGKCELVRFACSGSVVGAASRLFSYYTRTHNPTEILSFSDNRWFSGKMYSMLGFKNTGVTRPDYKWVRQDKVERMHKSRFRKSRLVSSKFYRPELSETEICKAAGMYRVFDCGLTRWTWSV